LRTFPTFNARTPSLCIFKRQAGSLPSMLKSNYLLVEDPYF